MRRGESLVGTAVLGTIVTHSSTNRRSTNLPLAARQALAMNLEHVFLVTLGVGVAILFVTLFLKDVRLRKRGEGMPTSSTPAVATSPEESVAARSDNIV